MDPLSIASGVAGLLTLAGSVISTGYTLASKIKHRDEQVKALVQEIAIFSGILVGVQGRVKANESEPYAHLDLGEGPSLQDVLESCTKTLNEAESLFQSVGELNPVKLLLKGEAVKEQMESITGRVEHYKSFFTLFLQLQSGAQSDEIKTTLNLMVQQLGSLHSGQEKIQNDLNAKELAKQRSEIIKWLGPVESHQEEIREERDAESGAWIFKRDEFDAWLSSEKSSYLWLNGAQGTGKTTIVSKIIELLEEATSLEESSALAFHYCQFSNSTTLSPERVIGALVSQLLSTRPTITLPTSLQELFKKPSSKKAYPPLKEIAQIFAEICADLSEVYIIIDGLDELKQRKGMIWFLHHLSDLCPNVKLKVIISSRPEVDLEMAFEFYGSVSIAAADNLEDMERYVRRQVANLDLEDEIEANELIEKMVQKADGMFLWVVYQLNHFSRIRTAINSSLIQDLPRGLEKSFESTLAQLEEDDKALALDILRWLMFAKRPLSLEELVEAIAIKPETKTFAQLQKQRLRRSSDIFEICGSLIRQSKISGKLSLAHYSIFEWLSSRKLSTGVENEFYLDLDEASALMTQACAVYLSLDVYGTTEFADLVQMTLAIQHDRLDPEATPSILSQSRFLDYASRYWWAHIEKGLELESVPEPVMTTLKTFFQLGSNFTSWVGIASYLYGDYQYPPGMTPLHVAVLHGLKWLTTSLFRENPGSLCTTTSDGRLPLHIALENDGGGLVSLLVPDKRYLDLLDKKGRSPLQLAIYSGNAKVVRLLIHVGADVNAPFPDGGTALSTAIENGLEDLAELISTIASFDTLKDGRTLLHIAAQSGSIVWVSNLIQAHEEMVHAEDANGWTPLHDAAENGHVNVVSLLLNANCLVHPKDRNGWTPLHAAVHRRHPACIGKLVTTRPAGRGPKSSAPKIENTQRSVLSRDWLESDRQRLDKKYGRHYSVESTDLLRHSSAQREDQTSDSRLNNSMTRREVIDWTQRTQSLARSRRQRAATELRSSEAPYSSQRSPYLALSQRAPYLSQRDRGLLSSRVEGVPIERDPALGALRNDPHKTKSACTVADPLYIAVSDSYMEGIEIMLSNNTAVFQKRLFDLRKSLVKALDMLDTKILETLLGHAINEDIELMLVDVALSGSKTAAKLIRERLSTQKACVAVLNLRFRYASKGQYWKTLEFVMDNWPVEGQFGQVSLSTDLKGAIDYLEDTKEKARRRALLERILALENREQMTRVKEHVKTAMPDIKDEEDVSSSNDSDDSEILDSNPFELPGSVMDRRSQNEGENKNPILLR